MAVTLFIISGKMTDDGMEIRLTDMGTNIIAAACGFSQIVQIGFADCAVRASLINAPGQIPTTGKVI